MPPPLSPHTPPSLDILPFSLVVQVCARTLVTHSPSGRVNVLLQLALSTTSRWRARAHPRAG
eukprot:2030123-Pleurochrysis_carterae.AAC.1